MSIVTDTQIGSVVTVNDYHISFGKFFVFVFLFEAKFDAIT